MPYFAHDAAAVHHELDPLPQLLVSTQVLRLPAAAVDVLGPGDAVDQAHLVELALGSVGMMEWINHIWRFHKGGGIPIAGWLIMENPIKIY